MQSIKNMENKQIILTDFQIIIIKFCKGHYQDITCEKFGCDLLSHALDIFNKYYWDTTHEDNLRGLNRIMFQIWFKITKDRNHNLESDLWELIYNPDSLNIKKDRNERIFKTLYNHISFNHPNDGGYFYLLPDIEIKE